MKQTKNNKILKIFKIENRLSVQKPVSRNKTTLPYINFFLCCYILLKPKRGVRKKV